MIETNIWCVEGEGLSEENPEKRGQGKGRRKYAQDALRFLWGKKARSSPRAKRELSVHNMNRPTLMVGVFIDLIDDFDTRSLPDESVDVQFIKIKTNINKNSWLSWQVSLKISKIWTSF